MRRGRGDCEDYAIAKLQMLRAAGFEDRDLYLVIAKDLIVAPTTLCSWFASATACGARQWHPTALSMRPTSATTGRC